LIDKPAGMTSHDVVSRARRAVKTRSIGHTGTLDPFATGLLILLTGRATRLARYVEQQSKTYLATARLGFATTTDDRTGEPIQPASGAGAVREEDVAAALQAMMGLQQQTPPAYSAKKVGGKRSYHLARKGEAVALAPVDVTVHQVDLVEFAPPLVTFRARVSAGTYIRAMGRDLGERLGIGAHLEALRREAVGTIGVEDALLLADLVEGVPLQPLARVLGHLDPVELTSDELKDVGHGRPVRRNEGSADLVRLVSEDRVVAVARRDGEWLRPVVVLEAM
jgi:tRNA pseudouridine55 synthase